MLRAYQASVAEHNRETGEQQESPRRQGPGHGCVGVPCWKGMSPLGANRRETAACHINRVVVYLSSRAYLQHVCPVAGAHLDLILCTPRHNRRCEVSRLSKVPPGATRDTAPVGPSVLAAADAPPRAHRGARRSPARHASRWHSTIAGDVCVPTRCIDCGADQSVSCLARGYSRPRLAEYIGL